MFVRVDLCDRLCYAFVSAFIYIWSKNLYLLTRRFWIEKSCSKVSVTFFFFFWKIFHCQFFLDLSWSVVPLTHKCVQADLKTPGRQNLVWNKLTMQSVLHTNYQNLYFKGLLHLFLKLELTSVFLRTLFSGRGGAWKIKNIYFPRVAQSLGKMC